MIFYKLITDKVMKDADMQSVLRVLKRRGLDAVFDGFEHVKAK